VATKSGSSGVVRPFWTPGSAMSRRSRAAKVGFEKGEIPGFGTLHCIKSTIVLFPKKEWHPFDQFPKKRRPMPRSKCEAFRFSSPTDPTVSWLNFRVIATRLKFRSPGDDGKIWEPFRFHRSYSHPRSRCMSRVDKLQFRGRSHFVANLLGFCQSIVFDAELLSRDGVGHNGAWSYHRFEISRSRLFWSAP
jgi:hypothetical protein